LQLKGEAKYLGPSLATRGGHEDRRDETFYCAILDGIRPGWI
jgi:hypothetical protein